MNSSGLRGHVVNRLNRLSEGGGLRHGLIKVGLDHIVGCVPDHDSEDDKEECFHHSEIPKMVINLHEFSGVH